MTKCNFCGETHYRYKPNSKRLPALYCSTKCIKRASHLKRNPDKKCFGRNKTFWETETGIGFKWEKYVADKFNGTHMEFNSHGIDVVTSLGNIDVKVCEKYRNQWVFNRNKKKSNIDFYYCICLDKTKIVKELCIPTDSFKSVGITVGNSSKYDEFILSK